jgi:DHA1 family bicyclomycin/chloramphenicol resistance-like MFS transporter
MSAKIRNFAEIFQTHYMQNNQTNGLQNKDLQYTKPYLVFLLIFLGLMSAFGPFLTDMYLPTLPSMVEDFHTTEALVQFSLTMGMIGLAIGQVFFGQMSQKWGRKPILIASMALFVVAAVASIFSKTITFFLICRLAQGLGGAGGIVLARSIATDCYHGRELAKMMAIIGAINGIAPATAPVIGGLVANSLGWQGIFAILTGIGVVLGVMSVIYKETLPKECRQTGSLWAGFSDYRKVCSIKRFVALVLGYGFSAGVLFAYISAAPFIIQGHFHFNEIWFAVIFGINSVCIGVGSGLALRFKSLERAMVIGAIGMTIFAVLQLIGVVALNEFWVYESTTLLMLVCLGMVFTTTTSMAMDQGRAYTGAAAAIVGAIGFVFGGAVSPIVGLGNIQITTAIVLIVCSVISWQITALIYRRAKSIKHI